MILKFEITTIDSDRLMGDHFSGIAEKHTTAKRTPALSLRTGFLLRLR
jgi:hypothetical protein